jgi:NCS1 nucleoside transporter family
MVCGVRVLQPKYTSRVRHAISRRLGPSSAAPRAIAIGGSAVALFSWMSKFEKEPDIELVLLPRLQLALLRWLAWTRQLDRLGVETRGIERVTMEERAAAAGTSRYRHIWNVMGLWFAACGGLTTMSSFFLPTFVFGLNVRDLLVSGLVAMVLGCLVPAYTSTMGPQSGLRQMASARFLFGWWGVKFVALVCIVGGIGWLVVNCVLGGQVLAAVLDGLVSLSSGIVIIAVISLVVAVFGIKVLLRFQFVLAVPITVASMLFYVVVCQKRAYLGDTNTLIQLQWTSLATSRGNWLSFFTIGYLVTATWGLGAADYYVLFPPNTLSWLVFWITFGGIAIPSAFVLVVSILCGCIAFLYAPWNAAYQQYGIGGLLDAAFAPWGRFGKFVVVLLYLLLICNNIMNTYLCAFEFQLIDARLARCPRWLWATLVMVIYLVILLAGKLHLLTIIGNFLPMLAYWISIYITLLLEENLVFRRWPATRRLHGREFGGDDVGLYNWSCWNDPLRVTMGLAAVGAFAVGAVGAVLGMNQVYWRGPVARRVGEYGGDVGFWLCMAFAGVAYPPMRYLELKRFAR